MSNKQATVEGCIFKVPFLASLCLRLMNKLLPGSVSKINTSGSHFKLMENINAFQAAAKKFGVPEIDVFQTVDLWERRNIPQVTQCIMALGRAVSTFIFHLVKRTLTDETIINSQCYTHPEWPGPFLGPKPSEENRRDFSDEQLRAGEAVISLQYGTNKGANQSGQNFGNTRHM